MQTCVQGARYNMTQRCALWKGLFCLLFWLAACEGFDFPYQNYSLPVEERIDDFISRLTTPEEKAQQLVSMSPGIESLEWKAHNWRSECCHGWGFTGGDYRGSGWNGTATVFPQVIGLAATWDTDLVEAVGNVAATEGRAVHNNAEKLGIHGHMMSGLHCFGPTTNVNHDPRWGRIKRTWGEDPFLTGTLNSAHIRGLQGNKSYIKISADVNMFGVHSGPDSIRQHFNADIDDRELFDYYMPAFQRTVQEGGVNTVMVAYSALAGVPDNCNKRLLTSILQEQWNFTGITFSDNSGVRGIVATQHYTSSYANASALAMNAGLHQDMASGGPGSKPGEWSYGGTIWAQNLPTALSNGWIKEDQMDAALRRVLRVRFALGLEDPPELVPWSSLPMSVIGSDEHNQLALEAARKSIVLLKNNHMLPLDVGKKWSLAVVGPLANSTSIYFGGGYSAYPTVPTRTILGMLEDPSAWSDEAQRSTIQGLTVHFAEGCKDVICKDRSDFPDALSAAKLADAVIYVGGIDGTHIESEGRDRGTEADNWLKGYPCEDGYSDSLYIPGCQANLISEMADLGKPVIVVLMNGGPVTCLNCTWKAAAILDAFYSGQSGSQAIIETLFGWNNPAGRMPYTVHDSAYEVPNFTDYHLTSLTGRTYRYLSYSTTVQHHFGDGLSYSDFNYTNLRASKKSLSPCDSLSVTVTVINEGPMAGDEVVQFYIANPRIDGLIVPQLNLMGFRRINLAVGKPQDVTFCACPFSMSTVDNSGTRQIFPGTYYYTVGGHQAAGYISLHDLIESEFDVTGKPTPLLSCENSRMGCNC